MQLQRRLFLWFGASIFATGLVVTLAFAGLLTPEVAGRRGAGLLAGGPGVEPS